MRALRTPDSAFADLEDYPFAAHYVTIDGLRMHFVDEGRRDAAPLLLLHGEPSWSYLYRHMITPLADGGLRVVAPDLIGFGKSDKPARRSDYSYARHVRWLRLFIETLDLAGITLFCQDWGSLIGLRVAAESPARFARIALANGGLPTGDQPLPRAFSAWRTFARLSPVFPVSSILQKGTCRALSAAELAAYDAPFPSGRYKAGARAFPLLVPTRPDDPASAANRSAWEVFRQWEHPFLTLFSDRDPITRGGDRIWQQTVPGAHGQPHATIENAGHFLQEDAADRLAAILQDFAS
jgi:haloalkane dehalogenase